MTVKSILNLVLVLVFVFYDVLCYKASSYCEAGLSCKEGNSIITHTACARKNEECLPSARCQKVISSKLTDEERQKILDKHNDVRMQIANGKVLGYNVPSASNMRTMVWNRELEFIAQCHVNSCAGMAHDKCRKTKNQQYVGQNLAFMETNGKLPDYSETDIDAIRRWTQEVKNMPSNVIDRFRRTNKVIGHFTQVAWAEATEVGCGRIVYEKHGMKQVYLACNYGIGNMLTQPIYLRGGPCSKCPVGTTCSRKWPGLCQPLDPNANYTQPLKKAVSTKKPPVNGNNVNGGSGVNSNTPTRKPSGTWWNQNTNEEQTDKKKTQIDQWSNYFSAFFGIN